jgi:capsular exopolysaccharide synthesis family protein
MSTFFRALERAEHERALRQPPVPPAAPTPAPAAEAAKPPVAPEVSPFSRPPREIVHRPEPQGGELEEHLVSLLAPASFGAEQYRVLRHMVEQFHRSNELSVIAISSPDASDGKTTTAINLAGALAQAPDARVLLVDADLRAANLASQLGLDEHTTPGLVEAIMNPGLTLDAVLQTHAHLNLSVLSAGRRPSAPYEVLKSPRVAELLAEARQKFDYVIIDTAPLVSVPDTRVIGKWVDGFLIVVAAHRTPRKLLEEALSLVEPEKIVGMVFNGDDRHLSRGSYASKRRRVVSGSTRNRQAASDD